MVVWALCVIVGGVLVNRRCKNSLAISAPVYVYVCICIYLYIYISIYTCISLCIYVGFFMYIGLLYMYIYIYIYIFTYFTYTYVLFASLRLLFVYLPFSVRYGKKFFFSIVWKSFDSYVSVLFIYVFRVFSKDIHAFFYKQHVFSTHPQCCLTVSWIDLQMLLRCCLIHISIIIQGYILYLVYLCPFLCLGLFMLYLCDLFFYFSLIFIVINRNFFKRNAFAFWSIF